MLPLARLRCVLRSALRFPTIKPRGLLSTNRESPRDSFSSQEHLLYHTCSCLLINERQLTATGLSSHPRGHLLDQGPLRTKLLPATHLELFIGFFAWLYLAYRSGSLLSLAFRVTHCIPTNAGLVRRIPSALAVDSSLLCYRSSLTTAIIVNITPLFLSQLLSSPKTTIATTYIGPCKPLHYRVPSNDYVIVRLCLVGSSTARQHRRQERRRRHGAGGACKALQPATELLEPDTAA